MSMVKSHKRLVFATVPAMVMTFGHFADAMAIPFGGGIPLTGSVTMGPNVKKCKVSVDPDSPGAVVIEYKDGKPYKVSPTTYTPAYTPGGSGGDTSKPKPKPQPKYHKCTLSEFEYELKGK